MPLRPLKPDEIVIPTPERQLPLPGPLSSPVQAPVQATIPSPSLTELTVSPKPTDLIPSSKTTQQSLRLPEDFIPGEPPVSFPIPEFVRKGALPTLGAVAGEVVGALSRIPGAPLVLSGLGAAGMEALQQQLGITEPSPGQIALEAAAPGIGRAISLAARPLRALKAFGTPRRGAETLQVVGIREAEREISRFMPRQSAKALFAKAKQAGGQIPMEKTISVINDMIEELSGIATKPPRTLAVFKRLKAKIESSGGQLDPIQLQNELEGLGAIVGVLERREGGKAAGSAKKVFEAMVNDLDRAADDLSIPGAIVLREARDKFKRAKAVETIQEEIQGAIRFLKGQGDVVQFNPHIVIRNLEKDPFFTKAFTPAEQKEIFDLFKKLNRIPALRPGAGVMAGSFRQVGKLMTALPLGAVGATMGPGGAAVGFTAGALAPPTMEVIQNIALALQFKEGRDLLKRLITKEGILPLSAIGPLSAFVAAQMGEIKRIPEIESLGHIQPSVGGP